jgi:hypothetical protein
MLVEIDKEPQEPAEAAYLADVEQAIVAAVQEVKGDPKSLHEVQSQSDWPRWKEAMDKEIDALEQAGTWETVPRPKDKNVVGSKWVCWTKYKADGSIEKYKAHVVAHGFSQVYGVDYLETYSPVAKLTSFRTILALVARFDWEIQFSTSMPCTSMESWRSLRRFIWSSRRAMKREVKTLSRG